LVRLFDLSGNRKMRRFLRYLRTRLIGKFREIWNEQRGIEIMKKISLLLLTAVFLLTAVSAANAQFTIKIPKMPKIPKVVTNDSGGDSSVNGDSNAEVFESKYAAADYDANIRPGTRVAAYQNVGLVDGEVISRKGNVYKVHRTDGTNVDDLFRAN